MSGFKLRWDENKAIPQCGYLGEHLLFTLGKVRGSDHFLLWCRLPETKHDMGYFKTEEEGKRTAERTITTWIKKAGLK